MIAIIAILASILFPVFAKAREKARQSSCLSNVKQIALGFMQYAQDYDEMFPAGGTVAGEYTVAAKVGDTLNRSTPNYTGPLYRSRLRWCS